MLYSRSKPLLLLLWTMLLFACICDADPSEFDVFVFAQQWPGTVCRQRSAQCTDPILEKISNGTTIHGLWPVRWDGTWEACDGKGSTATRSVTSTLYNFVSSLLTLSPSFSLDKSLEDEEHQVQLQLRQFPQGEPFDPKVLEPILPDLWQFWPSLTKHSDRYWFWKHEWEKHGSCLKSFENQLDFFSSILNLRKKLDLIHSALAKHDIRPDDTKRYKKQHIINALRTEIGVPAILICGANHQLQEFRMCVSKAKHKFVKCPIKVMQNQKPQCGKYVTIPVLQRQ